MNDLLYRRIHKRSKDTWKGSWPPSKDSYSDYCVHWFKCAKEIRDSFKAEGLSRTAESVQKIIDDQIKFNPCKEVLDGKTT